MYTWGYLKEVSLAKLDLSEEEARLVKLVDDDMLYFDMKVLLGHKMDQEEPEMKSMFSQEYIPFIEVEEQYLEIFQQLLNV